MTSYKKIIIDGNLEPKPLNTDGTQPPKKARNILCEYARKAEKNLDDDRKHAKNKVPALGSKQRVLSNGNYGFFSAVIESYNNHWILDMRPEDWFYTFVQKIALAIDKAAKTEEVRKFFVNHEDKKTLTVSVDESSPMDVDYSWFLDQMTNQIEQNINTPNYVELMTANFSTSTKTDRIVSSITTMMSMQEFFEYRMKMGCGIPAVAMRGTEEDWINLKKKIEDLENLLDPIKKVLSFFLPHNWWVNITTIAQNLLETYQDKPNLDWWHSIIIKTEKQEWGPSGMPTDRMYEATAGWFLNHVLGLESVKHLSEISNPLVTVPMKIEKPGVATEEAAFIAGITGHVLEKDEDENHPRVCAVHSWTLMLDQNSVYMKGMRELEDRMVGA